MFSYDLGTIHDYQYFSLMNKTVMKGGGSKCKETCWLSVISKYILVHKKWGGRGGKKAFDRFVHKGKYL